MKTVTATPFLVLPLGRMGENEYTRIQFDVSGWLNELPSATIGLYNQRPQDADAYPVDGITVEDGIVTWTITSAELAQVGKGRCELVAVENNVVAKSAIYNTIVFDALDGSGEAPDPWDSWQQTFIALKAEAVQAAQDAETAAEHYPRIVNGIWQVWDVQTEGWVSTGVHATGSDGQDGADGVSPTVSVTDISGGHRVTITDAEGQHTFDVLNGEDGTDGTDGQDGFSPSASVTQTATGATISITDKQGTTTANIENGADGTDGTDGFSPTVTVTDITGGHRVTITDAEHPQGISFDVMNGETPEAPVQDVQVNGTSVVTDGVAEIPIAADFVPGVVKVNNAYGMAMVRGYIAPLNASSAQIKGGAYSYREIVPACQHEVVYYGLAKAAGADMANVSGETVGVYPEAQKSAISTMLNSPVSVTGTTPTITALSGIQYVCGEVSTLDIALPASGIVDVVFQSGSTPTVLTITPPTGVSEVEWADGFDPDNLSANATYWLKVIDGKLGVATAWGVQSGGELFRLIETITLAEDTNIITRSQTPSGQPYNYHSMIVMIDAPAASKAMDAKIAFAGTYAAIYNLTLWTNAISTTKRMSFISIENIGTNLFRIFRNSGQQSTYSNATCELATNRYAGQQDDIIKSVTFGANNTVNMVPAGTVIYIYAK